MHVVVTCKSSPKTLQNIFIKFKKKGSYDLAAKQNDAKQNNSEKISTLFYQVTTVITDFIEFQQISPVVRRATRLK